MFFLFYYSFLYISVLCYSFCITPFYTSLVHNALVLKIFLGQPILLLPWILASRLECHTKNEKIYGLFHNFWSVRPKIPKSGMKVVQKCLQICTLWNFYKMLNGFYSKLNNLFYFFLYNLFEWNKDQTVRRTRKQLAMQNTHPNAFHF